MYHDITRLDCIDGQKARCYYYMYDLRFGMLLPIDI